MKRQLAFILWLILYCAHGTMACTATEKNANNSNDQSGTNTVNLTATINAVGDLVAITAWCGPETNCTSPSVTLGSQTAIEAPVHSTGLDANEGEGFIFYVLSASASGSQTLTFTESGNTSEIQVAYIDFSVSAGCKFIYDTSSTLGTGTGTTIGTPSITPSASGELLYNFTWVSEHLTAINSPWSCPTYTGSGQSGNCFYTSTVDGQAYVLSSSSGSTANNMDELHTTDTWAAVIVAFAMTQLSANECPQGSNYLNSNTGTLVTLASLGVTKCYYIAANGSDSNSGSYETQAWLHAPGMPNCASSCAGVTPSSADGFVFRGGDTWHFGNSADAPYTGGQWSWEWNGASGSPIYIGMDPTWYAGSSWVRPILTADNPLTPHPGVWMDYVSSCPYQSGSNDVIFEGNGANYILLDDFEMLGICNKIPSPSANWTDIFVDQLGPTGSIASRLYIHGWTHLQFSCVSESGICLADGAFHGGSTVTLDSDVVDGSDSDPGGAIQFYVTPSIIRRSVFRYVATGSTGDCHIVADTLWEYIYSPGDNNAHGDTLLCIGELPGTNAYYNFIMRYNYLTGETQPNFWIGPPSGSTDYVFNALMYGSEAGIENFNIQNSSGAHAYIFNNTIQLSSGTLLDCEGGSLTSSINNHLITDTSNPYYGGGTCATATDLIQTNAVANGQGYTGLEGYVYSPATASGGTVGTGTNEKAAMCNALSTAASSDSTLIDAATACLSDTRYACTYSTVTHSVSCPARAVVARPTSTAWDQGAYQFKAGTNPVIITGVGSLTGQASIQAK